MSNKAQRIIDGTEKALQAEQRRQIEKQRRDAHKLDPKTTVAVDARMQCYGSDYTPKQIEAIYTQPPQQQ